MEVDLEINTALSPSEAIEAINNEFKESGAITIDSFKRISQHEIRAVRIYGANAQSDQRDRRGAQEAPRESSENRNPSLPGPNAGSSTPIPGTGHHSHTPRIPERLSPVERITTPGQIDLDNYYLQTWSMKGRKIKEVSFKELEDNKTRLLPVDLKAYEQYLMSVPRPAIQAAFNLNPVSFEDDTIPY